MNSMPENRFNKQLKDYLASNNLIEAAKLQEMASKAEAAEQSLEEIIVEEHLLPAADLAAIKGKIFNLPVAEVSELEIPMSTLNLLPQKVAENYQMVIFEFNAGQAKVGLVDPSDFLAHESIEFLAKENGWQLAYYVISLADFRHLLQGYGGFKKEIGTALKSAEEKFATKEQLLDITQAGSFEETIRSAPVAKIVSVIIRHAIDGHASDIHIEPGRAESRVRYRVDGILHTSLTLPNYLHQAVVSRIKVLANLKLDETRTPQDGRIRSQLDGHDVDLRVSVLPMLGSEKVVIRVLDTSEGVPTLAELGLADFQIEIINCNIT